MHMRLVLLLTAAIGTSHAADAAPARSRYGREAPPPHLSHPVALSVSATPGPSAYLLEARSAVQAGRYMRADDALGKAETRLLNDAAVAPDRTPPFVHQAIGDIYSARLSAAHRQRMPAVRAINAALLALEPQPVALVPPPPPIAPIELLPQVTIATAPRAAPPAVVIAASPPPPPAVLYRLEPGHWQLHGAESVWIEPQTMLQPVSVRPIVPARQVWTGDKWVFVPEHFAGPSEGK